MARGCIIRKYARIHDPHFAGLILIPDREDRHSRSTKRSVQRPIRPFALLVRRPGRDVQKSAMRGDSALDVALVKVPAKDHIDVCRQVGAEIRPIDRA
jgi:hypothetical protein